MIETLVALMALTPFIAGIPLLGKQLDVKHKSYDAARYSVWERTVWRNDGSANGKHDVDISLEARDRVLGHPRAALKPVDILRTAGVTENPLWRDDRRRRLIDYESKQAPIEFTHREQQTPLDVGYQLVQGITHGDGPLGAVERSLQLHSLNLNRRAFANSTVSVTLRPVLARSPARLSSQGPPGNQTGLQDETHQIVHIATGALLTDAWSAASEGAMQRRVDGLTTNELLEDLEAPGRVLGMHAPGKGRPLYGEGQFGWSPDLLPSSTTLPSAYIAGPGR